MHRNEFSETREWFFERNALIWKHRKEGVTWKRLGELFHLSPTRARRVVMEIKWRMKWLKDHKHDSSLEATLNSLLKRPGKGERKQVRL